MENNSSLEKSKALLETYLIKTGVKGGTGNPLKRYLWTDAFAVEALLGLSLTYGTSSFRQDALNLIDLVHLHLGSYHPDDERQGRISGLSPEEADLHPTVAGLRIGKDRPERKKEESYNTRLEWERDGQYFHYLTRWMNALLEAERQTRQIKYAQWALELMLACRKFIYRDGGKLHLFWKMNTDLSYPLVPSTGAHDPLEGLVCCKRIENRLPDKASQLAPLIRDFETLCTHRNWSTSDSLGIGGLLLNTAHTCEVLQKGANFIKEVEPGNLFQQSLTSLRMFSDSFEPQKDAHQRLAFRECGLSLGIRSLYGRKDEWKDLELSFESLYPFLPLAQQVETFWTLEKNRLSRTWKDHEDINSIMLASSLIALQQPQVF